MAIGKMKKYREMLQIPDLRPHLPETHWMTDARTLGMLKTYSAIFIKPNQGSGGSGIIRVKRLKSGYEVRRGQSMKLVGASSVLKAIHSYRKSNDRYLDGNGRIWIIEANSHPGHMLFTQLSDRTIIRTILANKENGSNEKNEAA